MRWKQELEKAVQGKKVLVLGVGNDMKGDDALGRYVIDRLKTKNKLFCGEMPENFISRIKSLKPDAVLIVDAVDFQGKPGEIAFTDAKRLKSASTTTHSLSFSLMSKLLPDTDMFLIGVQPLSLGFGKLMSLKAKEGAENIIATLNALLN